MNGDANPKSPLLWFFDAFLQERNIKWVLTAGVLILLGSSLMMVTSQWEQIGNVWKYVIFAGYLGVIHFAGQWSYRHLALRKTGTVLMGLTVLLIPVTFVAWNLFWSQSGGSLFDQAVYVALLCATGLFAVLAARQIFHHFLRGSQPTFVACYLILAFAGAVAPSIAAVGYDLYSWAASAGLWAVFLIGSIKVNRHVFWLVEHHESPRILGFFPIMLLGGQFLGLFGANFALQIEPAWTGIICVLLAVPVLLTADAVASVFQSRTGGIVRPLPWPIVLPLILGIILCVTGVGLALIGVDSPVLTNAMVPTAGLAAVLMALVARRTGKSAFVWAMLAGTLLTYQASPSFFLNLVERVLDLGAKAFNEERLPYAFYGLTYLPLILATTAAAVFARRAKSTLFAPPLRHFAVGLSAVLLVASFVHPVSIYPTFVIGLLMTTVFAFQAVVFRNRLIVVPAILAWLVAATGAVPFAAHILGYRVAADAVPFSLSVAAALLLVPGAWLDRLLVRLPLPAGWESRAGMVATAARSMCQVASLTTTCVVAAVWLGGFPFVWSSPWLWPTAGILAVLLVAHSLKWLNVGLSAYAFGFVQIAAVGYADWLGAPVEVIISLVTLQWIVQWAVDYGMRRYPQARIAQAFAVVNRTSALWCLSVVAAAIYGPIAVGQVALPYFHFLPLWLPCFVLVGIWVFDAARRFALPAYTVCGFLYALVLAGWAFVDITGPGYWALGWLPALWAGLSLAALPVARFLRARLADPGSPGSARDAGIRAIALPLEHTIQAVLAVAAVGSLLVFTWPMRVAGGIALVGLIATANGARAPRVRTLSLALVNWQLVCVIVQVFCGADVKHCLDLSVAGILPACLPAAVLAAASLFVWQRGFGEKDDAATFQRVMLRVFACGAILFTLQQLPAGWQAGLGNHGVAFAVIAFATLACSEFFAAQQKSDEVRVWFGELIIAAAVGYFVAYGLITFGGGSAMLAVLGAGLAAYICGRLCDERETLRVFVRPFVRTGLVLPLVTVGIGLYRYFVHENTTLLGLNSLALMLAAGFYFYLGVERKRKWLVVLAAAVANTALSLLWLELAWSDPQFFMIPLGISILLLVELLRAEIPAEMRDPLRYAGALVILVSPMFHVFDGSWLHLLTWMIASVGVLLLAIGLRVRALVYTGTAFLVADLVGMVVRGSVDHPNLLWLAGVVFGAAIVVLGAICENNRERVLQRMRTISARLETWN